MDGHTDRREIEILYTDQQGDMAKGRILPKRIFFGKTPWSASEQWILEALDVATQRDEIFALKDIQAWLPSELQNTPM